MSLDELKNRIKDDLPISSVIGQYLDLHRQGQGLVALCPFHQDTKPSMNVNDNKKMYKCFACGAGGDAITFVQKYRNLDFIESLKEICEKNGINFESYKEEKKSNPKVDMAKKILAKSAMVYRKTATSKAFLPYNDFITKRGLDEEIATTYSLGFAPNRNSISDYLNSIPDDKEKSFAVQTALEIGIIKKDKNDPNLTYDTFRDRIIFPIWDSTGVVIGYTSRAIRDEQKAKYMNSVDSFIFNKGNLLYGFHLAKSYIRERDSVIVVEGNMDQIALFHNGFQNAVAIMGVAMGEQSIKRLTALTKNIYIALDNDGAGQKAAERLNQQLLEEGILGLYVNFEPVKDADDFLKIEGRLKLQERLDNAKPMIDVILDRLLPNPVPELSHKKLEVLNKAFEVIKPLKSGLAATERAILFAKRLGLTSSSEQIVKTYEEFLLKQKAKPSVKGKVLAEIKIQQNSESENLGIDFESKTEETFFSREEKNVKAIQLKSEKLLLQELVQNPNAFSSPLVSEILAILPSDEVKKYITRLSRLVYEIDESEYVSMVSNLINSEEVPFEIRETISSALFQYKPRAVDEKNLSRLFFDVKMKVKTEVLIQEKEELKKFQESYQTEEEFNNFLTKLSKIEKELQLLKKQKHK